MSQLFPACPERLTDLWSVRVLLDTPQGVASAGAHGLLAGTDAHLASRCRKLLEEASPLGSSGVKEKQKAALPLYEQALEQCRESGYLDSAAIAWRGVLSLQRELKKLSTDELLRRGNASLPLRDDRFALQRARSLGLLERIAREAGFTSVAAAQIHELTRLATLTGHPELALQATQALASFGLATAGWAMAWQNQVQNEALAARLGNSGHEALARERGVELRQTLGLYDEALSDAARTYKDVLRTKASVQGKPERANTNLGVAILDAPALSPFVLKELLEVTGPALRSASHPDVHAAQARAVAVLPRSPRTASLALAEALFLANYWKYKSGGQSEEWANEALNLARLALVQTPVRLEDAQHWLGEAEPVIDHSSAVAANRRRELVELQLELALQQRKLPEAERLVTQMRALDSNWENLALRDLQLSQEKSMLSEARVQALAGDSHGALELFLLAAEEVAESAAQAGLAGFSQGYLMQHRAAGDQLLQELPFESSANVLEWLGAFSAVHASRCLPGPGAQKATGISTDDWARYDALSRQRAALRRQLLEVVSKERASLQAEILQLEPEWRAAWLKVNPCIPSEKVTVSVPLLQKSLPEDGEIWVLASLPDRVRGVRIRRAGVIPMTASVTREQVYLLRQHFVVQTAPPLLVQGEALAALQTLSELVPEPGSGLRRVMLVLDPFLAGIPFELLPTAQGPFGKQSALSYVEGLEALVNRGKAVGTASVTTSGPLTGEPVPLLRRVLVGVELGVSEELNQVYAAKLKSLVESHGSDVVLLAGNELSLKHLSEQAHDATLLHLMVHGKASPQDPLGARLRLKANELSVLELQQLPLQDSAVLLMACQSGPGGVHGAALVRALHAGGARTVLASRWLLPQEDVDALAPRLYDGLARGLGLAEALQSAVASSPRTASILGQLWISGDPGW